MDANESVFWLAIATTLVGFTLKFVSLILKSKCTEVSCGCLKIIRDTSLEEKEHEFDLVHRELKKTEEV